MIDPTTQEGRIFRALKEAGEAGMHPTRFVTDLGILMYNSRINGIRKALGCTCIRGRDFCMASEHIINRELPDGTTKFYYRQDAKTDFEAMRLETIAKRDEAKPAPQPSLF